MSSLHSNIKYWLCVGGKSRGRKRKGVHLDEPGSPLAPRWANSNSSKVDPEDVVLQLSDPQQRRDNDSSSTHHHRHHLPKSAKTSITSKATTSTTAAIANDNDDSKYSDSRTARGRMTAGGVASAFSLSLASAPSQQQQHSLRHSQQQHSSSQKHSSARSQEPTHHQQQQQQPQQQHALFLRSLENPRQHSHPPEHSLPHSKQQQQQQQQQQLQQHSSQKHSSTCSQEPSQHDHFLRSLANPLQHSQTPKNSLQHSQSQKDSPQDPTEDSMQRRSYNHQHSVPLSNADCRRRGSGDGNRTNSGSASGSARGEEKHEGVASARSEQGLVRDLHKCRIRSDAATTATTTTNAATSPLSTASPPVSFPASKYSSSTPSKYFATSSPSPLFASLSNATSRFSSSSTASKLPSSSSEKIFSPTPSTIAAATATTTTSHNSYDSTRSTTTITTGPTLQWRERSCKASEPGTSSATSTVAKVENTQAPSTTSGGGGGISTTLQSWRSRVSKTISTATNTSKEHPADGSSSTSKPQHSVDMKHPSIERKHHGVAQKKQHSVEIDDPSTDYSSVLSCDPSSAENDSTCNLSKSSTVSSLGSSQELVDEGCRDVQRRRLVTKSATTMVHNCQHVSFDCDSDPDLSDGGEKAEEEEKEKKKEKKRRFGKKMFTKPLRRSQSAGCTKDAPAYALFLQHSLTDKGIETLEERLRRPIQHSQSSEREIRKGEWEEEAAPRKPPPPHARPIHKTASADAAMMARDEFGNITCQTKGKKSLAKTMKRKLLFLRRRHTDTTLGTVMKGDGKQVTKIHPDDAMQWSRSFESLLLDKTGLELFRGFLRSEFSDENLEFWIAVEEFKQLKSSKLPSVAQKIYTDFVAPQAPREINLDAKTRMKTLANLSSHNKEVFEEAQRKVQALMEKDSYPRFLESEVYQRIIRSQKS